MTTSNDTTGLAVIEARVRHFGEPTRDEVVQRSGAQIARHEVDRDAVLRDLASEAARQESALAVTYASAFAQERRRLAEEDPPIASLGDLPASATPPPASKAREPAVEVPAAPAPESALVPDAATAAPRFVPSYLRAAPVPPAADPSPAAAPAAVPTPAPVLASTPVDIRMANLEAAGPDSTQPPIRRSGPAVPFTPGRVGERPAGARAATGEEAAVRAPVAEEATRASDESGDETAFLPRSAFTGPATPFEKKKVESAETMALDEAQLRAAAATPEPWIRLEEYAAFLGELAKDPSRAGVLRAKYGIAGEDAQRALGAGFAAKFQADPSLRLRFDALLAVERAKR